MPAGYESYAANGKLQFDTNMLTYKLQRTGSVTSVAPVTQEPSTLKIPANAGEILALRNSSGYAAAVYPGIWGGSTRWFMCNAPVGTSFDYYAYSTSNNIPSGGSFGMECYNASGQITFSTRHRVMQAPSIITNVTGEDAPVTHSGKSLAFSLLGYGGGKGYGWDGEYDSGGFNAQHTWTSVGAYVTDSGRTVRTTTLYLDNSYSFYGAENSYPPGPEYGVTTAILVVDVTGIPIGQTFF
jgi:hypothetical protein